MVRLGLVRVRGSLSDRVMPMWCRDMNSVFSPPLVTGLGRSDDISTDKDSSILMVHHFFHSDLVIGGGDLPIIISLLSHHRDSVSMTSSSHCTPGLFRFSKRTSLIDEKGLIEEVGELGERTDNDIGVVSVRISI